MIPTDTVAHWIALAMIPASFVTWVLWRLKWHRDDRARRKANLEAGIASERRLALMADDPDESTQEILALDPPVDRTYIPPVGMVLYRGGAVHPDCAARWLRFDQRPIDGCAVWLTDELKAKAT